MGVTPLAGPTSTNPGRSDPLMAEGKACNTRGGRLPLSVCLVTNNPLVNSLGAALWMSWHWRFDRSVSWRYARHRSRSRRCRGNACPSKIVLCDAWHADSKTPLNRLILPVQVGARNIKSAPGRDYTSASLEYREPSYARSTLVTLQFPAKRPRGGILSGQWWASRGRSR